jgi:hypothetical protein
MIASVPASAAGGPPEPGASTQPAPQASRSRSAIARVAATSLVEWSTRICLGPAASATPPAPKATSSTASVVVTQTSTMSLSRATSAGARAGRTPCRSAARTLSGTRSWPVTA